MSLLEAIFLGILQGATEFLPISSSGHLLLVPRLLKLNEPSLNTIAIAHEGTLLAVLIYFRRELWHIVTAMIAGLRARQPLASAEARLGWRIVVASVPAVIAGLILADTFDRIFGQPNTAAFLLLGTSAILIAGERLLSGGKKLDRMTWPDAVAIGLAQMLALLPGISRSGTTIAAGLGRGLDRATAARFSFLLGIPAIAGAGFLSFLDLAQAPDTADQMAGLLATFLASAIVGYTCIHFLLTWLRRRSLYVFAFYCAAFAIIFLVLDQTS